MKTIIFLIKIKPMYYPWTYLHYNYFGNMDEVILNREYSWICNHDQSGMGHKRSSNITLESIYFP